MSPLMFALLPLDMFIVLLAVHFVADFVLQTHWQASNKYNRLDALGRHVSVYTACLAAASFFLFRGAPLAAWALFVVCNGVLHFATDYFTSKWTHALYAKQQWHNFFVAVGFDQLIHQVTLAAALTALLAWWS